MLALVLAYVFIMIKRSKLARSRGSLRRLKVCCLQCCTVPLHEDKLGWRALPRNLSQAAQATSTRQLRTKDAELSTANNALASNAAEVQTLKARNLGSPACALTH